MKDLFTYQFLIGAAAGVVAGVALTIAGLVRAAEDDEKRLAAGLPLRYRIVKISRASEGKDASR